jgi:hypothetical protein
MTTEERMNANLLDHGMHLREEREAVIELAKRDEIGRAYVWGSEGGETLSPNHLLWRGVVKRIARDYLAEHNPTATYRGFFDE